MHALGLASMADACLDVSTTAVLLRWRGAQDAATSRAADNVNKDADGVADADGFTSRLEVPLPCAVTQDLATAAFSRKKQVLKVRMPLRP